MNEETRKQLDAIAQWAQQCDQQLALIRWQLLADRLHGKAA